MAVGASRDCAIKRKGVVKHVAFLHKDQQEGVAVLLSTTQAEPGRNSSQSGKSLLADPCTEIGKKVW